MSDDDFNGIVELDGGWVVADASAPVDVHSPSGDQSASPVVNVEPLSVAVVGPRGWPGRGVDLTLMCDRFWPAHAERLRAASWSPTSRYEIRTHGRIQLRRLSGEVVAEVSLPIRAEGPTGPVEVVWNTGDREPWQSRRVASELWVHAWYVDDAASEASDDTDLDDVDGVELDEVTSDMIHRADPGTDAEGRDPAERLAEAFEGDGTPLIRTDFSDDDAWSRVVAEATQATDFDGSPYGPYEPHVIVVDDRRLEGATGESLAEMVASHDAARGYAVLADARSMSETAHGDEITVVYVDLSVEDEEDAELFDSFLGRSFRLAVGEFASIEANFAIGNMDFHEFADNVQPDGVFRGFDPDA